MKQDMLDYHHSMEDFSNASLELTSDSSVSRKSKGGEKKKFFESFLENLIEPEEHDEDDDSDDDNSDQDEYCDDDDEEEKEVRCEFNDCHKHATAKSQGRKSKSFSLKAGKLLRKLPSLKNIFSDRHQSDPREEESRGVESHSSTGNSRGSSRRKILDPEAGFVLTDFPGLDKPIEEYAKSLSSQSSSRQKVGKSTRYSLSPSRAITPKAA